jgi:hypothetical protein
MPDLRDSIRKVIQMVAQADEQRRRISEVLEQAKILRFAWAEDRTTLHKFKSLSGGGCRQVQDIIENSRLYFSTPEQFNDPLDCSPTFKLAGDLDDPAFLAELKKDEDEMIAQHGLTPQAEVELREQFGIHATGIAEAIKRNVRKEIRADLRIFCLSANYEHPLLWSHYGNSHTGICLHFSVVHGNLFGLARGVDYSEPRPPVLIPMRYNEGGDTYVARAMSLIKAEFWRYESEYRILGHASADWGYPLDGGRFVSFEPELLTGVTLGMCIAPADRSMVMSWAAAHVPELAVFEAFEHPEEFGIGVRQLA